MKKCNFFCYFAFAILLYVGANIEAQAYSDTEREDLVIDAPWRTIRDYLPVLFFAPDFKPSNSSTAGLKIQKIVLSMYDRATQSEGAIIFSDDPSGSDVTVCSGAGGTHNIQIIDPMGNIRSTLEADEIVLSHWHYVVRIPTACIGPPGLTGQPGLNTIKGKIIVDGATNASRVMRVVVDPNNPLPKFSPQDRHYDIHVHTIAEQTRGPLLDIDAGYKAFGGPLAMLIESAYAIGMVDRNLASGNWMDFKNQISTTDHNTFFSGGKFDSGHPPRFGPTRTTNGKEEEFSWYRKNFGVLGGEEITLPGTGRIIASGVPDWGSHFLAYGGPHFEGPWHGGNIDIIDLASDHLNKNLRSAGITGVPGIDDGTDNPLGLRTVLSQMGQTDGFGYAAHPFSTRFGWPSTYFTEALGFGPFGTISSSSPQVTASGNDFVFKGSQVWNGKKDFVARAIRDGDGLPSSTSKSLNPFAPGEPQQFVAKPNWDNDLILVMPDGTMADSAIAEYIEHVKGGLFFSFSNDKDRRFLRKVYMSAGTDAHGDFNYLTSVPSTIIFEASDIISNTTSINIDPKIFQVNSNAFGRVRTYALAADRDTAPGEFTGPPSTELDATGMDLLVETSGSHGPPRFAFKAVDSYRDGNTILTDGPIGMFHIDANCRLNSDSDRIAWHDSTCKFENKDGAIGGKGNFDGGRTALVPRSITSGSEVWIQTKWKGKNDYYFSLDDQSEMSLSLMELRGGQATTKVSPIPAGPKGQPLNTALIGFTPSDIRYNPTALILRGNLEHELDIRKSMFITNPIWTVPYTISISKPEKCPIAPSDLKVSVKFGISMESTIKEPCVSNDCLANPESDGYMGAQVSILALDGQGNSVGRPQVLANRKWGPNNLVTGNRKIDDANFLAINTDIIDCPVADWDADTHQSLRNQRSYAVVVSDLHDTNRNHLNSIGKTFTVKANVFEPGSHGGVLNGHSSGGGVLAPPD